MITIVSLVNNKYRSKNDLVTMFKDIKVKTKLFRRELETISDIAYLLKQENF